MSSRPQQQVNPANSELPDLRSEIPLACIPHKTKTDTFDSNLTIWGDAHTTKLLGNPEKHSARFFIQALRGPSPGIPG